MNKREREREREREKEGGRETDRQTETEKPRPREKEKERDREIEQVQKCIQTRQIYTPNTGFPTQTFTELVLRCTQSVQAQHTQHVMVVIPSLR